MRLEGESCRRGRKQVQAGYAVGHKQKGRLTVSRIERAFYTRVFGTIELALESHGFGVPGHDLNVGESAVRPPPRSAKEA